MGGRAPASHGRRALGERSYGILRAGLQSRLVGGAFRGEGLLKVDNSLEHDVALFGAHVPVLLHLRVHGGKRAFHVADFKLLDEKVDCLR